MFGAYITNSTIVLNNMINKDPGMIVGPITKFLGAIVNVIFNVLDSIGIGNTLGFSIIVLTIFTRLLMLPLAFQSQKSMAGMQKIQPEIDKINKKYTSKEPDVQQKKNTEIQALYAKHKINPFGGCLPLFIQLPIFFALNYLMRQAYLFIGKVGIVYDNIATKMMEIPADAFQNLPSIVYEEPVSNFFKAIVPIVHPKLPNKLIFDPQLVSDVKKGINSFTEVDWSTFLGRVSDAYRTPLESLLQTKHGMESFFGINLVEGIHVDIFGRIRQGGFSQVLPVIVDIFQFPAILIPILVALATFYSSYTMSKQPGASSQSAAMQKQMLVMMPFLMFFMTFSLPAGVGLYWITSSFFQGVQQIFINKYYHSDKKKGAKTV